MGVALICLDGAHLTGLHSHDQRTIAQTVLSGTKRRRSGDAWRCSVHTQTQPVASNRGPICWVSDFGRMLASATALALTEPLLAV